MAAPKVPHVPMMWLMRYHQRTQKKNSAWDEAVSLVASSTVNANSVLPSVLATGLPYDKVVALRQEFIGAPVLCFYNAQLIACLRRGRSLPANFNLFNILWNRHPDALASHLNLRWMLSSIDTFADLGAPGQREAALAVSAFVNMARFADSERYLLAKISPPDGGTDLASLYQEHDSKTVLWDGIKVYNVVDGDGIQNFLERMHRTVKPYPAIRALFEQIVARMLKNQTVLSRLADINQRFDLSRWREFAAKQ